MSYVPLIHNFKATTVVNFIQISLQVFEVYCKTTGVFSSVYTKKLYH